MTLNANNLSGYPTVSLQPGNSVSNTDVIALQNWLVKNGFLTQAQMNTGPGIYGPATTAAVTSLQQELGVNAGSSPGYYGLKTIATIQAEIDALTPNSTPNPDQIGIILIEQFEGFISSAKFDQNAYRVGYGDDLYAVSNGSGGWTYDLKVTSTTTTTQAAAAAELQHRIDTNLNGGIPGIERDIGTSKFLGLSPLRQAVLESIVWNYGSLQGTALTSLLADLKNNSSNDQIANDIQVLTANASRRADEASLWRWEPPGGSTNKPDLAIAALTVGSSVALGGTESISFSIVNSGNAQAIATSTKLYLSADAFIDGSDTAIGTFSTSALSAGQVSSTVNTSTVIPSNLTPGTWYIIAQADSANIVTNEVSETNNVFARSFIVTTSNKPDLAIGTLAVGATVTAGGTESISFEIVNSGSASAVATSTKLYLSADAFIDGSDSLINTFSTPALTTGQVSPTVNTSTVIPSNLAPGTWYIIAQADSANVVTNEVNENNNVFARSFIVNAKLNHAPVVAASDVTAAHGQTRSAASLFSVSDADSDAIQWYALYDNTADATSGHFALDGVAQPAGQLLYVTSAQLAQTTFVAGSGGSDDLFAVAFDGLDWSAWKEFHVFV